MEPAIFQLQLHFHLHFPAVAAPGQLSKLTLIKTLLTDALCCGCSSGSYSSGKSLLAMEVKFFGEPLMALDPRLPPALVSVFRANLFLFLRFCFGLVWFVLGPCNKWNTLGPKNGVNSL